MGEREKHVAAALFVVTALILPALLRTDPTAGKASELVPFLVHSAATELKLEEGMRAAAQELDVPLPELEIFKADDWVTATQEMEVKDRTSLLTQVAVACLVLDRKEDAHRLLATAKIQLEPDMPFSYLLGSGSLGDPKILGKDIQASSLPDWLKEPLATYPGNQGKLISADSAANLQAETSQYFRSVATLFSALAALFLAGIFVIAFAPRLLQNRRNGDELLTMIRFGTSPMQTYVVFAGWFLLIQALGIVFLIPGVRDVASAWLIAFHYVLTILTGVAIIRWRGMVRTDSLVSAVDLEPSGINGKAVWAGVLGYVAAVPIVVVLSVLSTMLLGAGEGGVNPAIPVLVGAGSQAERIMIILNVAVMAPVFEEFFFRGFLFQQFKRHFGLANAIALSALVFSAVHMSIEAFLPLFGLGVIMAVVYHRTQCLWSSIITHALWNLGTVVAVTVMFG